MAWCVVHVRISGPQLIRFGNDRQSLIIGLKCGVCNCNCLCDMEVLKQLPKSVFFITASELAERFAFYGLAALLPIYLVDSLKLEENTSTSIFHFFKFVAYFSPLVGSVLADVFFGKFKVISVGAFFYFLSFVWLSISAFLQLKSVAVLVSALIGIALCTGMIKSVVSALVGDQIDLEKENGDKILETSYQIFYASINIGTNEEKL